MIYGGVDNVANMAIFSNARYVGLLAAGYHKLVRLELSDTNTITYYGPSGTAPNTTRNSGIMASLWM
jgi:hypothetical protein